MIIDSIRNATQNETDIEIIQEEQHLNFSLPRCYPTENITENCTYIESSTTQFWEKYVLNITQGGFGEFGDLGGFKYDLPLALLLSWIVVFLCLMKGVKSSGKVLLIQ